MIRSTIAALATPIGFGGIGIIKISGPQAFAIARRLFSPSVQTPSAAHSPNNIEHVKEHQVYPSQEDHDTFRSHLLYHGYIVDPETQSEVDEVLVSFMKAPRTYTCEDVVEINAHSGPTALKRILELVILTGAHLAEPGEFTKRAFLNDRIDLTQAEGVIDLICARTDKERQMVMPHLQGVMAQKIGAMKEAMRQIAADVEAYIEFADDLETELNAKEVCLQLKLEVLRPVEKLLSKYQDSHYLREGLRVTIVGAPNVGKSSIMNRMLEKDRVIVAPSPGTTRDAIEETLNIDGIPVVMVDTAGLQATSDPVERIGIRKTNDYLKIADLILFVIDISRPITAGELEIFKNVNKKPLIMVLNKIDLVQRGSEVVLPDNWTDVSHVKTSALLNEGIQGLKKTIRRVSENCGARDAQNGIVPNLRQKIALEKCLSAATVAYKGLSTGVGLELVGMDIKEAALRLDEILGQSLDENILDLIFSRFCIGK